MKRYWIGVPIGLTLMFLTQIAYPPNPDIVLMIVWIWAIFLSGKQLGKGEKEK